MSIYFLLILLSFNYLYFFTDAYLFTSQWNKIDNILTNKDKYSLVQIQKIHTIIYNNYEKWALNKASQFKHLHKYKSRGILLDEIKLYATIGLYKAIKNYDPIKCKNTTFSFYAAKYVVGECYTCVTELQPLPTIKKYERKKGVANRKYNRQIQIALSPTMLGDDKILLNFIKKKE
jgi:hypothetical protein